jgi:hypothetical protein
MSAPLPEPRKRVMPEHPANISKLQGELSPDKKRIRVTIELDREDTRPDLDLFLQDAKGIELCHSTIIENFGPRMNFTLHIRQENAIFPLRLVCQLSYLEDKVFSEKEITLADS